MIIFNSLPLSSLPYSILGSSSKKQFTLIYPWLATQENRSFMRSRKRCVGGGTFYPEAQWTIAPFLPPPLFQNSKSYQKCYTYSFLGCANPGCMCSSYILWFCFIFVIKITVLITSFISNNCSTKGQLISKCPFRVKSPKKPMINSKKIKTLLKMI